VVAAGLVWLWELPVSNYLRTGTWNWGQVRVWCTVILVILVPLLLFSGFRSEWLDNTLPLQWDNDEVWEPGFIQYCISWSWLWCVLCHSEMQVGHWLWGLIDVEVWLWLTVVLLFPRYIMMILPLWNYSLNARASIGINVQIYRMLGSNTLIGNKILHWIGINVQICRL